MMPNGRAGATPGRVVEVGAAAMLSIPTTGAGIGTAGREGIAMDPLGDPPRGEFSRTAMMPSGRAEETPELEETAAGTPLSSTRETPRDARTAMIPKGSGPSPENIRSLHHAYRGGQRGERTRGDQGTWREGAEELGEHARLRVVVLELLQQA